MVCIVIPVHNRKELTQACIESLLQQTLQADYIIVVDDGSTDGTAETLQEYSNVIVLQGNGNLFWTASVNLGIKLALDMEADYVMTLNNDTVATSNFLERMMQSAEQNPGTILGAFDVDIKTKLPYYGGEIFNWRSGISQFLLNLIKKEELKGLHEVSLFPGRGLLVPKIVFETIGLFAEKQLPHYMADYDFTLLAKRNGFKIFCNYDAVLYTYPEEGGDHKLRTKKTLKNYFRHLFSIRGGGNLRNFTVYALRNCPRKDIVPALFSGYLRRVTGFWIN